ncbi:MAG TPA: hypothetical protein VKU40_13320, partial [Thermoanaerobaculia bacterium]|nr:hypothetical protein [Thermoanaerobaculia bacterium]
MKSPASLLLLFCLTGCAGTGFQVVPGQSIVLSPEAIASGLRDTCSRPPPPPFEDTWQPSPEVIAEMEGRMHRLEKMRARRCCIGGARVRDVNAYHRQYAG